MDPRHDKPEYTGAFHHVEKIDKMVGEMMSHDDPYRLVYKWMQLHQLSFKEFMEVMKTYERYIKN